MRLSFWFLFSDFINYQIWIYPTLTPPKFNRYSPWKMMGMEDVRLSYWVPVTFQGLLLLNFGRKFQDGVANPWIPNHLLFFGIFFQPGSSQWPKLGCFKWPFQGLSDLYLWVIKRSLGRSWNMMIKLILCSTMWPTPNNLPWALCTSFWKKSLICGFASPLSWICLATTPGKN